MSGHDESTRGYDRLDFAGTSGEEQRLRLMERACDPLTIAHLERTGVAEGWRCLEVGAGAGSIAAWLADRAGASCVTATELSPHYLASVAEMGVRVLRHDVEKDPAPGADYDLVHARLVLEHLTTRDAVVERLASWLAPGGWLVLEDATFVPEIAARPALRRLWETWTELVTTVIGSDFDWARTFPVPLERAGLTGTSAEVSMPVMRGGNAVAAAVEAAVRVAAPGQIARGMITEAELDEVYAVLADTSVVDCSMLMIVAWGRRPQTT